jgi:hypothetical protein
MLDLAGDSLTPQPGLNLLAAEQLQPTALQDGQLLPPDQIPQSFARVPGLGVEAQKGGYFISR